MIDLMRSSQKMPSRLILIQRQSPSVKTGSSTPYFATFSCEREKGLLRVTNDVGAVESAAHRLSRLRERVRVGRSVSKDESAYSPVTTRPLGSHSQSAAWCRA